MNIEDTLNQLDQRITPIFKSIIHVTMTDDDVEKIKDLCFTTSLSLDKLRHYVAKNGDDNLATYKQAIDGLALRLKMVNDIVHSHNNYHYPD
jgi:hypothetical protein